MEITETMIVITDTNTAYTKVNRMYELTIRSLSGSGVRLPACTVTALNAEVIEMFEIGKKCNHKTRRNRNVIAFERTTKDLPEIISNVEDIELGLLPSVITNTHLRTNLIISAFISSVICMYEFVERAIYTPINRHILVFSDIETIRQLRMIISPSSLR